MKGVKSLTRLRAEVWRATERKLDGSFGVDSGKVLTVGLIPAAGVNVPEQLAIRPYRSRRTEYVCLADLYRWAIRCRVNREVLERARERKVARAVRLASERQRRAEKRLVRREAA